MTNLPVRAKQTTLFLQVAWRNLWRNRRRTLLTVGAIGFGVLIVQMVMSLQSGSYGPMIELGTRMGSGHVQILHASYHDEPRIEYAIADVSRRLQALDESPAIAQGSARAEAFALVSNDPHSSAAMINGVIPEREMVMSDLPSKIVDGTYLDGENQAIVGAALARNLQLNVGNEIVVIGTNPEGGIAATVLVVQGIFEATAELERVLIQTSLATFQDTFEMGDQAHRLVALVEDPMELTEASEAMSSLLETDETVLDWAELMPEISQGIEIDIVSNAVLQIVLLLIVVLSVMNTFVMTLFERTRECGMLFAIGMKRSAVYRMTLTEAVLMWLVGLVVGGILTCLVIVPLSYTGISIPASDEALQAQFSFMPESIYPDLSWWVVISAPLFIGVGALIAVSLASVRLVRLDIIQALRTE